MSVQWTLYLQRYYARPPLTLLIAPFKTCICDLFRNLIIDLHFASAAAVLWPPSLLLVHVCHLCHDTRLCRVSMYGSEKKHNSVTPLQAVLCGSKCCGSGEKCCGGQCLANGSGNFGDPCCGGNSNFTACLNSLVCNNANAPGKCLCPNSASMLHLAPRHACQQAFLYITRPLLHPAPQPTSSCCRQEILRQQQLLLRQQQRVLRQQYRQQDGRLLSGLQ